MSQALRLLKYLQRDDGLDKKEYIRLEQEKLNAFASSGPCAHENHLFELDDKQRIHESCCKKFVVPEKAAIEYGTPKKAPEMRTEAAGIGRNICGICVSTLYGKEDVR